MDEINLHIQQYLPESVILLHIEGSSPVVSVSCDLKFPDIASSQMRKAVIDFLSGHDTL